MTIQTVTIDKIFPTAIWVESDLFGSHHVMVQHDGMEPFTYATFNYCYAYTNNAGIHAAANKLALELGATEPVEQRNRASTVEAIINAPGVAIVHESCWLIEATAPPRPLYFAGDRKFVEDADKAIRFPTQDSADWMLACHALRGNPDNRALAKFKAALSGYVVREHIFDYTPRAASPTPPSAAPAPEPAVVRVRAMVFSERQTDTLIKLVDANEALAAAGHAVRLEVGE